jgi:hypothetical protein
MADYDPNKPEAAATLGGRGVTAVGRTAGPYDLSSPSGTDWNQTFYQNNPYSPSGTDCSKTFGRNNTALPPIGTPSPTTFSRSAVTAPYAGPDYGAGGVNRFAAGDTTQPPSPGDIDNTFFGGPAPTPTPTPRPSPAIAFYRSRMQNAVNPLTSYDFERYGLGSEFGV